MTQTMNMSQEMRQISNNNKPQHVKIEVNRILTHIKSCSMFGETEAIRVNIRCHPKEVIAQLRNNGFVVKNYDWLSWCFGIWNNVNIYW